MLKQRTRKVAAYSLALVVTGLVGAQAAMAQAVADPDITGAVTDNAGIIVATITGLILVVLGPRLVMVLISLGKRLIGKAAS
jgi:hypothetical protein